MLRIENHCCDCAVPGYPCRGSSCPNRHVEVHYCDECGCEIAEDESFFDDEGRELCEECADELEDELEDEE